LHRDEKKLAGGSEVLKLKATFFKDWKKYLVGEQGHGNLPRVPGSKRRHKKHFVVHDDMRYSGNAVGNGDDDIGNVDSKDTTNQREDHLQSNGPTGGHEPNLEREEEHEERQARRQYLRAGGN
jgi:hypothetical protein